jgi:serine/threonine protein kinase
MVIMGSGALRAAFHEQGGRRAVILREILRDRVAVRHGGRHGGGWRPPWRAPRPTIRAILRDAVSINDEVQRLRQGSEARIGVVLSDKYRIESLLGFGGTAAVYVATNVVVGRPCAIKVLHGEHKREPEIVERFRREAFAANRIRVEGQPHPNVVDIIDAGESDGHLYLVQELLRGETLAEYLLEQSGGRLAPEVIVALMRPVIHAIATAHAAGVVHRDIKPDNVFLVDRSALGRPPLPKVLDFGIAQLRDARITVNDRFHGTPSYMAPETFGAPASVDAHADVWALGLTIYEAITGQNPFDRGDQPWFAIMHAVQNEWPPPPEGVEPALRSVLRRCLQKKPEHRFDDAAHLLAALDASMEPDNTLDVAQGTSAERLRESVAGSELRCNGLRFIGPWSGVGEVLAVATLEEFYPLRALHLCEPPSEDTLRRNARNSGGNEICSALSQHPSFRTLSSLEIAGGGVSVVGVAALADSEAFATLETLNLSHNRLGDLGAVTLADAPHLSWLSHLDLSTNAIGNEGAKAIAAGSLVGLRHLDLSHNRIGDEGARAIAESAKLSSLESVNLDGNPISPELAKELRDRGDKLYLLST